MEPEEYDDGSDRGEGAASDGDPYLDLIIYRGAQESTPYCIVGLGLETREVQEDEAADFNVVDEELCWSFC